MDRYTLGDSGIKNVTDHLRRGLSFKVGPFVAHVTVCTDQLMPAFFELYQDHVQLNNSGLHSFHIRLVERRSHAGFGKAMVRMTVDGQAPHENMPADQALAVFEWGMNLVIALRSHAFLMLHAAVVEIDDKAMLLPAAPGSGKTTLAAGLVLGEWRLFSDEFGLIRPGSMEMVPIPRPMALKNESIDVIRQIDPTTIIGPKIRGTRKGTVAHLKPPVESVRRSDEYAPVKWIVFPRWMPDVETRLTEISRAESMMRIAGNAFNYEMIGEPAFHTVAGLVDGARCFDFEYSDLPNAVNSLTDFVRRDDL